MKVQLDANHVRDSNYAWAAIVALLIAIAAYALKFGGRAVGEPEAWGQLGDFLGGIVNPAIGIITAFLLVRTLRITRQEAAAARAAILLDEIRGRLDAVLTDFIGYLKERKFDKEYYFSGVSGAGDGTTLYALLVDQQFLSMARVDGQNPDWTQAISRHRQRNFQKPIEYLVEIESYCHHYEHAGGDRRITDYYRRRVQPAVQVLTLLNLIPAGLTEGFATTPLRIPEFGER